MARCRLIREALGLSQPAFGELLGVSQAHVSRMEAGQSYSRSLDLLLDRIAVERGLPHLVLADVPRPDLATEGAGDAVA